MRRVMALFLVLLLVLGQLPGFAADLTNGLELVTDRPGLYELSLQSGEGWPDAVAVWENLLLILRRQNSESGPLQLTLYDVQAMEKRAGITLSSVSNDFDSFEAGFLADGRPYTIESYTKRLVIYNATLQVQSSFTPPKGETYYSPYMEPSGNRLWLAEIDGQRVKGFDINGANEQTLRCALAGDWMFSSFAGMQDGRLLVVYTDMQGHGALHVFDTATGKVSLRPILNNFSYYLGGELGFRVHEATALFYPLLGGGDMQRIGAWRAGDNPIFITEGLVLSQGDQTGELRLYDLEKGLLLAALAASDAKSGAGFDSAVLSAAGFAVLTHTDNDEMSPRFYLWRYTQIPLNLPAGMTQTSMEAIQQENDRLAAEIEQAHGIKIHLRQAGHAFGNATYYGTLCDDEITITEGLEKLSSFLSALPPGLLSASLLREYTQLGFYLSGPILPRGEEGISSAAGLSSDHAQERYIIFDAFDYGVPATLAHEFMHQLEDRLEENDLASGHNLLGGFVQLSPRNYDAGGYNYGYRTAEGFQLSDTAYTWEDTDAQAQPQRVWYIDSYARSYPLEDRARIFEELFTAGDSLPECFISPHLMTKAKYLCALIRAAFPELAFGPAPIWEKHIPAPAGGDWSEYLELPLADAA